VVARRIPEAVRLAQRPRPSGSGGSSVDPAWGNPLYEDLGDSKSAGGARGRWRREGGGFGGFSFSLSRESESRFDFVIIAVFLEFVSVLEKGLRPLVLAINVSKFLPASSCSKKIVGIWSKKIDWAHHTLACSIDYITSARNILKYIWPWLCNRWSKWPDF